MTNGNGRQHGDRDQRREQLSAYLDGELEDGERKQLEAHLVDCAACQRELAELRQMRQILRALPKPALPRSFTLPVPAQESATTAARRNALSATGARTAAHPARRGGRLARAAQWTGGLAASVGLLLILGSALLAGGGGQSAASNASTGRPPSSYSSQQSATAPSASGASTHQPQVGAPSNATHTPQANDTGSPTATPTDTPSAEPSATNAGPQHSAPFGAEIPSVSSSEILGLAGAGLAGGGVLLFVGGSIGRRRRTR